MKTPALIALSMLFLFGCTNTKTQHEQSNVTPQTDTVVKRNDLNKTTDVQNSADSTEIVNKYWKLITLEGQPVTMADNQAREAYFILKMKDNRVEGFAGCNTFNGTYTLEEGARIRFSKIATTLMACPDVDVNESEFLKVFELANNYSIYKDTLSLNVGRRAPLAVFKAIYF